MIVYCVGAGTDYNSSSGAGYGGGGGSGVPPVMMSFKTFLGTQDDPSLEKKLLKSMPITNLSSAPSLNWKKLNKKLNLKPGPKIGWKKIS